MHRQRIALGALTGGLAVAMSLSGVVLAGGGVTAAKVALVPRVEMRAKQITIDPGDLPRGWAIDPRWDAGLVAKVGPVFECRGHAADFSKLVVHGAWSSRIVSGVGTSAFSRVTSAVVFDAAVEQAKIEFRAAEVLYPQCVGASVGAGSFSLRRLPRAALADQEVGFRSIVSNPPPYGRVWADAVFLRRGGVYEQAVFERAGRPFDPALEDALLRKLASRAHT